MEFVEDSLIDRLRKIGTLFGKRDLPFEASLEEPPLRSELFSADQMEQHGRHLAGSHVLAHGRAPDQLLPRLADNEDILRRVFDQLTEAVTAGRHVTPASEWLLDNFYLIEEQIRTAKRHLPKNYSRELPRLAHGSSAGFPRVYDIALETIAHGDGRVDLEGLSRFLAAYQSVTTLEPRRALGDPDHAAAGVDREPAPRRACASRPDGIDRDLADDWARQMISTVEQDPKSLILVIADMARSNPPMTAPFVSEFVRDLQGQSPALALAVELGRAATGRGWPRRSSSWCRSATRARPPTRSRSATRSAACASSSSVDWRRFVEVDERGATRSCARTRSARMPDGFRTRNRYRARDRAHRAAQRAIGTAGRAPRRSSWRATRRPRSRPTATRIRCGARRAIT